MEPFTEIYIENSISPVLNARLLEKTWQNEHKTIELKGLSYLLISFQVLFKLLALNREAFNHMGIEYLKDHFLCESACIQLFLTWFPPDVLKKKWEGGVLPHLEDNRWEKIILRSFLNLFFNLYRDKRLTVEGSVIDTIASHLQKLSIESWFPVLQEICCHHFILKVRFTF